MLHFQIVGDGLRFKGLTVRYGNAAYDNSNTLMDAGGCSVFYW